MARPNILSELTPLPAGTFVTWRYIGGTRQVTAMDYAGRSSAVSPGEPTFIIRYLEPNDGPRAERQRNAYASDLTVLTLVAP